MLMARRRVQAAKNMKAEAQTMVSAPEDHPAKPEGQMPADVAPTELAPEPEQPKAKAKGKSK